MKTPWTSSTLAAAVLMLAAVAPPCVRPAAAQRAAAAVTRSSARPGRSSAGPARSGNVDDARLLHAAREPQDWLTYGGTWDERRYSTLGEIDTTTVKQLRPAWYFDFDTTRGQESTPLVVDGVMYVSTAWSKVYALDARTGREIWLYDPKVPGPADVPTCCGVVNRGVAVYEGKVYVGTLDGRLIALDAATGKPVWSVRTFEPSEVYAITGAPRAARGKVFIGNSGSDFGGRGYVSAYDAATGKLVWRFYTVPGKPGHEDGEPSDGPLREIALPTWHGHWWRYGGGGNVWNAIVYDPDFNQLYLATGNGYPWNENQRSAGRGDNLFLSSIIAVDADTGHYRWHYQEVPEERWDYDSTADIALVELRIGGRLRKVLLQTPKDGFCYVIDRRTGKLLSAKPYIPGLNWAHGVDPRTGRPRIVAAALYRNEPWTGIPGAGGAHVWQPIAFSPSTGLLYLAAKEGSGYYLPTPRFTFLPGVAHLGIALGASLPSAAGHAARSARARTPTPTPASASRPSSYLLAWNPVTQTAAWRAADSANGGGVLATAGGLVFQGRSRDGLLGEFDAYRADDGRRLWSWKTPNAISAGPITYSVGGDQYVAVTSGASFYQSMGARARVPQPGRLIAFKLHGTATLPADPPFARPANPPAAIAPAAQVAAGAGYYGDYCARCHGFGSQSGNVIPDLRRSAALTRPEAWRSIVLGGALAAQGMVSWSRFLTPAEADAIRAYVGEQARALQRQEHSSTAASSER
ncbi:MAG: PQQ-dependent dehydrogenase, methanol/ethanol family [Steroidobacteraceae bacterium]